MPLLRGDGELEVLERFEFFADHEPGRMALTDDAGAMTYAALNVAASGIAKAARMYPSIRRFRRHW